MNSKPKYKTRQRDILLSYLKSVSGVHITAADACDYFKREGIPIGQSTVYRRLECLVDEGLVKKYIIDGTSPACFEYVGEALDSGCEACFHFKCEKCGCLIHLHCDELSGLKGHLEEHHHVTLNPMRTVLYGLCEKCSGESRQEED